MLPGEAWWAGTAVPRSPAVADSSLPPLSLTCYTPRSTDLTPSLTISRKLDNLLRNYKIIVASPSRSTWSAAISITVKRPSPAHFLWGLKGFLGGIDPQF